MSKCQFLTLAIAAIAAPVPNSAQQFTNTPIASAAQTDYQGVYYEVWGTSSQEPSRQRPWSEPLDSLQAAQARLGELKRNYSSGGLLATLPDKLMMLHVVKRIRGVADKVDLVDSVKAEERKIGDALKEYANQIRSAYERLVRAKRSLTGGVNKLTSDQLSAVNRQIDDYNRLREDVGKRFAGNDGCTALLQRYPAIARLPQQRAGGRKPKQV